VVLVLTGCSSGTAAAQVLPPSIPVPPVRAAAIGGVPLQPVTAGDWHECQQVADSPRAPVPCPTLLPVPMPGTRTTVDCGALGGMVCGRPLLSASGGYFLLDQFGFVVPADYVGQLPGGGHVVVMSARRFDARSDPALPPTPIPGYCAPVPQVPPLVVPGHTGGCAGPVVPAGSSTTMRVPSP